MASESGGHMPQETGRMAAQAAASAFVFIPFDYKLPQR